MANWLRAILICPSRSRFSPAARPRTIARGAEGTRPEQRAGPKRITAAMRGNPHVAYHKMNVGNNFIGTQQVERLVNAGLAVPDNEDVLRSQLAEDVPTLENGLWKRPFVDADTMLGPSSQRGLPLPKHLLEQAYSDDRAGFLQLLFWSQGFVGAGPFRMREWVPDSHLVLEAFDRFVLGRPMIDEIEIRFIPDTNAVVANILAGTVEYTMDGRSIPFEEARNLQAQWRDGRMELATGGVPTIFPQFLNANPPVVTDVRFRRALMHAMDRHEMVDSIQGGLTTVAHTYLGPGQRDYKEVESSIVRYEYDPRKAVRMIEGLGYTRGTDGNFRDSAGSRLTVPLHTTITVINQKATLAVTDNWQKVGVGVDVITIPLQRQSDREFMFEILGQIIHHETDQLVVMRVFFDPEATMIGNRLRGVPAGTPWNAHEWDLAG